MVKETSNHHLFSTGVKGRLSPVQDLTQLSFQLVKEQKVFFGSRKAAEVKLLLMWFKGPRPSQAGSLTEPFSWF